MEEYNLEDQHYILVSEQGEVIALFYNSQETGDILREYADWVDPTWDQIEAWDGLQMILVDREFLALYDEMVADGEPVTLEIAKPYVQEG
jgi:hypothetical protein